MMRCNRLCRQMALFPALVYKLLDPIQKATSRRYVPFQESLTLVYVYIYILYMYIYIYIYILGIRSLHGNQG